MSTFTQDLVFAGRTLLKRPAFTVVAVLTLALGIGANAAIFSVVEAVLLRPLPFPEPERLTTVWEDTTARGGPAEEWTGAATYRDWRDHNRSLTAIAAYTGWNPSLTGQALPERLVGERATVEYFAVLGVEPAVGRAFDQQEGLPGGAPVAILGHDLWQRRFAGDPGVVGDTVSLDGEAVTVVGIAPAGFRSPFNPDTEIWAPFPIAPDYEDRGNYYLQTVARLAPGVSADQARADLLRVNAAIAERFPTYYEGVGITLVPLHEAIVGPTRPALLTLFGAVGLVLLIACVNVANLLLARGAGRAREMAVRASLGAGRLRLVRQLLTESVLLAAAGGVVGLGLGAWGVEVLRALAPQGAPRLDGVGVNPAVLGFTLVLALVTGLVFGLVPAFRASRLDLATSLRQGPRSGDGRGRLRAGLVIAEVALALALLVGAGLLLRSFVTLIRVDPGFRPQALVTASVNLPRADYREPERVAAFFQSLTTTLEASPGVAACAAVSVLPLSGGDSDRDFSIEGAPPGDPRRPPVAWMRRVTPSYLEAMGIPLVRGRAFTAADRAGGELVAMVNTVLARRYFGDADPIGRRVKLGTPDSDRPWITVVGLVGEVRARGPAAPAVEEMYLPHAQSPLRFMTVVMRSAGGAPAELVPRLRSAVAALDPNLPVAGVMSGEALLARSLALPRFTTQLLAAFAAVAMLLAALGLYGVMAHAVSQRTREIGVRMALGARGADVLRMVVGQGLVLTAVGLAIGIAAALALSRFLESLLFEVSATDPLTFAATALLLVATSAAACYLPARRAARVDPVVSLRYE